MEKTSEDGSRGRERQGRRQGESHECVEAGFEVIVSGEALLQRELLAGVTAAEKYDSHHGDHRRMIPSAENPRKRSELPPSCYGSE
jgi:hypothetical protein